MNVSNRVPNGLSGDPVAWRVWRILNELGAVGRRNAVKVETLSCRIFPERPSKTDARIRSAVVRLRNKWRQFVFSCTTNPGGIFISHDPDEINDFLSNMESRAKGIYRDIKGTRTLLRSEELRQPGTESLQEESDPLFESQGLFGESESIKTRFPGKMEY